MRPSSIASWRAPASSDVLFAIGVPNVREYADPSLLVSLAGEAEHSGWDGFFVWDHLVYHEAGDPVADPWIVMAAIAQATERMRLGVLVAALARRRPWKVARETATLDLLSRGRLIVGAGLGSLAQEEFAAFAEDADARVRADKLDEALEIISGLWGGEEFSFRGRYLDVAPVVFRPRPVQRPRPPVWVGGRWPARRPFRRAARWDGVFATHSEVGHNQTMSAAQLEGIVRYTLSHRATSAPFDVVIEGQTADAAGACRLDRYAEAGLTWWIEKLGWFRGPLEQMRARIRMGPPSL
jgi:alkanesulfonate monooxygenase SsuD/methylene tetrahydromethanopterin reductase-like flavin-dependent oxidoreductase (luciferase family)